MNLVFNELSVNSVFINNNPIDIRKSICDFVRLLHCVNSKNIAGFDGFILVHDINTFGVPGNYGIKDWLKDSQVSQNHKQLFRTIINKSHYIRLDNFVNEFIVTISESTFSGIGLVYAAETDSSVLSIATDEIWLKNEIEGKHLQIDEDANLISTDEKIRNIVDPDDIDKLEDDQRLTMCNQISSGQDLWEQRGLLFPNLVFCDGVKDQLYADPERFHILRIMSRLKRLQEYFESCDDFYDAKDLGMDARTESETVKTNPDLKQMRCFKTPDGREEYFFDHIGFHGKFSGGRIHFLPHKDKNKCYIGYIGKHLPTKKF